MGAMLTYGSYLDEKEDLVKTGVMVAFLDTFIALVAGLVIFSIVFSFDLEPGSGPGLMFATLPGLFVQLPGGNYMAIMFFLLVTFAALSSAVSILEVAVTYFSETKGISRNKMALIAGGVIYVMGYFPLFSFNKLSDVKILGKNFFDLFDVIASNYLLPIGGLLIAMFIGWVLGKDAVKDIVKKDGIATTALLWLLRVVAPLAVFVILLNKVIG
jgi:NSS family neurotransmitter:Na+ symporter